jgi:hypothetical protein
MVAAGALAAGPAGALARWLTKKPDRGTAWITPSATSRS